MTNIKNGLETAIFGGGCFWCTETAFSELKGVKSVVSGYAGGRLSDKAPTYENISTGKTSYAEVVKVDFNPALISYSDLLTVFFAVHDPTTLNRQGNDIGTQYRSIILYTSDTQKREAEEFIAKLNEEAPTGKVVTEVKPVDKFYAAEGENKNYYKNNPDKLYCQLVISPKINKLREKFKELLKR